MVRLLLAAIAVLTLACCGRESYDEKTAREMSEYSQTQCPRRIDPYTILDSIVYRSDCRELCHFYTVQDTLDNEEVYSDELCNEFRDKLLTNIRNSVGMKTYKSHGVNFAYQYRSGRTGKVYLDIKFSSSDYKE
ncbi:MAG: hypothetical protein J5630_06585 [Bacteroidaceae bacterium]|nr:hypothetical protein [Bacteroidaceae bacterium]